MKITKNDFMDCLREVTKSKILAIKEAKEIFEARVQKLVRAQEYELRTQEPISIRTAQDVFLQHAEELRVMFQTEALSLQKQYQSVYDMIRFYQRTIRNYGEKICVQEMVIGKMQAHVGAQLASKFDDKIKDKLASSLLSSVAS